MKKYGNETSITTYVDNNSLIINIPIKTLESAFNYSLENYQGEVVKHGKTKDFADLIAKHLHDEVDSENGTTHIHVMLDSIYNEIFEGNIDTEDITEFEGED